MIQIDVTMTATNDLAEHTLEYQAPFVNLSHLEISAFFKSCLEQNLILNLIDNYQTYESDQTTYYATTMENALVFEQKFQDLSADFSMRKFWNQHGFDTVFSMQEVDFDLVGDPTDPDAIKKTVLLNEEASEIWGIQFPYYE